MSVASSFHTQHLVDEAKFGWWAWKLAEQLQKLSELGIAELVDSRNGWSHHEDYIRRFLLRILALPFLIPFLLFCPTSVVWTTLHLDTDVQGTLGPLSQ